jgi:DNA-binding CsgD family transcriptional regulator
MRSADVQAIVELLACAGDPTEAIPLNCRKQRLFEHIGRLIDADVWIWLTGRTNKETRGDSMAVSLLDGGWKSQRERAIVFRALSHPAVQPIIGRFTHDAVLATQPLTQRRVELLDDDAWHASPPGRVAAEAGFDHFLASVRPLEDAVYSAVTFCRRLGRAGYTPRDAAIVDLVFQQVPWIHNEALKAPALSNVFELSPRERQVMLHLLGGDTRKQVAAKLRLSEHTVADYLKVIYRKLGIKSRAELFAKFIHGGS